MLVSIKTPKGVRVRASGDVEEFVKLFAFAYFVDWLCRPKVKAKKRRRLR
jgi:hypothetical protein